MIGESRILVVDDEPNVCRSCSDILSRKDWKVETALSGNECIRKTRGKSFDVVILDLKIPDITGTELLQLLREQYPEVPIIIITGYSTVASAIETIKMGAFDYIPKPFTPEEIRGVVERALIGAPAVAKEPTAPATTKPAVRFLSPKEVAESIVEVGRKKTKLPILQLVLLGMLAGIYIGFGAELSTMVTHDLAKHLGVGFAKFIGGSVFSVGLMLVIIAGAELFTGNCLCLTSVLARKASTRGMLRNWSLVYLANFAGSILLVVIMYYSGLWRAGNMGVGAAALKIAAGKQSLSFTEAFFRGVGCNWLVCLAVWMAVASKDVVSKIFGIYFPIMAFVASGFEHSIANMYFIPMGLFLKGNSAVVSAAGLAHRMDNLTWFRFFTGNLLPVTMGNIVGGALFVGGVYYLIYLRNRKN